jgi:tetratricopeptide (TPR) repeat protein
MDDNRLSKVGILIQQKKFAEAEKILSDLLVNDSNNAYYLSLLAEVNMQQGKFDQANTIIDNAIGLSPYSSYLFYIKSRIALQQDHLGEAEQYINQAIAADPNVSDYFALLASIKLGRKEFSAALDMANKALETDAENLMALNVRSTALNKLNRKEESFATIEGALREDPNNAYTHANYGWGLLEKGEHKKALEHFKEALTNDPTMQYAQAGLLQALKATNPLYRIFLKYAFWMSNLTAQYQWGVIIGFYLCVRILRSIARNNEALQPILTPLIIALALIAFSTWVITPISNLFLRFNKYGQLLLDKKEKISSNFVAISFGIFITGLLLYVALSNENMLTIAVFGFTMMVPLSSMFSPSKNKNGLLIYTIAMAVVGIMAIGLTLATGEMFNMMTVIYMFAFIAFQWVANYMLIKEDNR